MSTPADQHVVDEDVDQRALLSTVRNLAASTTTPDAMLATVQEYVDVLDERQLTILALYRRDYSPSAIARMMNEDPGAIRGELKKIFVDLRLKVFPV